MKSLSDLRMLLSKLSTLFATVHSALSCLFICLPLKLTMLLNFSYIKGLLGGPTPAEYDALKQEKEDLKQQLESAKKQLEDLQAKVRNMPLCHSCLYRAYICIYFAFAALKIKWNAGYFK